MITLTSTNPKFSWILRKNPETQHSKNEPFSKALRKGMSYGWFSDDQTFKMMFRDSNTESSFNTISDFEYLDRTRYSSPYLPIALIGNLLASAQKEETEEDVDGYENSITFIAEFSDVRLSNRLLSIMTDISYDVTDLSKRVRLITIKTTRSIRFLLNVVISYLVVHAVIDPNLYIPMDEESVKKYIAAMNVIDAPYYARYIMAMKCIKSPQVFKTILPSLENGKYSMNFGDTQNHRYIAIDKHLTGGKELFDIGCGELYYSKRVTKRYEEIHAFDADPEIQKSNEHFVKIRNLDNIKLHGAYGEGSPLPNNPNTDVLLTEVLEHMPFLESSMLLCGLLSRASQFNKIIITVPNKDFNRYYGMNDDDMRHLDHKWEPTEAEFDWMMQNITSQFGYTFEYFDVGDGIYNAIDNKYTRSSIGCIIKKK